MANSTLNEHLIRISSRVAIKEQIELSDEVTLEIKGQCVRIEINDNQDGTFDRIAVVKPYVIKFRE